MSYVWQLDPTAEQNNERFFDVVFSYLEMMRRAVPEHVEPRFRSYQPELQAMIFSVPGGENVLFLRIAAEEVKIGDVPIIDTSGVLARTLTDEQRQSARVFHL